MKVFRKAILMVHGFAGGTYDFGFIAHELECVNNYDVFTFTLPGHDGIFKEKITYDLWIKKAEEQVEYILNKGYKTIYLIGHSMGGVIATHLACKYKNIKKLVLAAPAFEYFGYEHGKLSYSSLIHKPTQIVKQYGVRLALNRMFKLPLSCVGELRKLVNEYYDCAKDIKIPTLILWGDEDNVVPKESIDYLEGAIKKERKIIYVKGSTHNLLKEDTNNKLANEIIKFFKYKFGYDFSTKYIDK